MGASKAAVRVGLATARAFAREAKEEAARCGERFTGGFVREAFVEAVAGLGQVLRQSGLAASGAEWTEAAQGGREEGMK